MTDTLKARMGMARLSAFDLDRVGDGFRQTYGLDETPCFDDLLAAIDNADRETLQTNKGEPA